MVLTQINTYESSIIQSSTYDFQRKELTIQFPNGSYVYQEVDPETHAMFVSAESQGVAHNQLIKGKFECTKA